LRKLEQIPIAKKQFIIGIKILDATNDNPCAKIKSVELVEKAVVTPPLVATIAQNTGIKAYTKSEATVTVEAQIVIVVLIFIERTIAIINDDTVEYAEDNELSVVVLKV
jgi:hypothetical protein